MLRSDTVAVIWTSEVGYLDTCQIGKRDVDQPFDTPIHMFSCYRLAFHVNTVSIVSFMLGFEKHL